MAIVDVKKKGKTHQGLDRRTQDGFIASEKDIL